MNVIDRVEKTMGLQITGTSKDDDGNITQLCGDGFVVDKATAIGETLAAGNGAESETPYYVVGADDDADGTVSIRVYPKGGNESTYYLRTDADKTKLNNLDNLPDC